MNNPTEPIIETETIHDTATVASEKKNHLKVFILLFLLLALAAWAFWTYSPLANQWRQQWLGNTHTEMKAIPQPTTPSQPVPQATLEKPQDMPPQTPLFEPKTNVNPAAVPTEDTPVESVADLSTILQQLQEQMFVLQHHINQMQTEQLALAQQQVRAQMFTLLQQAASVQNNLEQRASAWKSLSLLPLIDEQRRNIAKQAFDDLQGLNRDAITLNDEISDLLSALASQLQPKDLADVAKDMDNFVDPYTHVDTSSSWLDWLKAQFKISKVNQHALTISADPYADIKTLMTQLHQLQEKIKDGQWQNITAIDTLLYQLEQHGIQTSISADMIENMKQMQGLWRQEAQTWMEQL